jgi:glucose-1-phosphate cytidylyltransferase
MRMRDGVTSAPKPMVTVGERPLLWHVMRYYAYFGHTDFVLCLGYGATVIKDFFLNYEETRSNDFVLEAGHRKVGLAKTDISEWRIAFVDTGLHSSIGERLRRVRRYVEDEQVFMANYADAVTDAHLPDMVQNFQASDALVSLMAVPLPSSHHAVCVDDQGFLTDLRPMRELPFWENGGYFVFRPEIFEEVHQGEDLVGDALPRLVLKRQVLAYRYGGFWSTADTLKERAQLEEMYQSENCPWMLWDPSRSGKASPRQDLSRASLGGNLVATLTSATDVG